jgi:hypothetical protein
MECLPVFRVQFYWTTTCSAVLWLTLPALAVTVAVYVPGGVPGVVWEDDELPPQPTQDTIANNIGAATSGKRLRLRRESHSRLSSINIHTSGIAPGGKLT